MYLEKVFYFAIMGTCEEVSHCIQMGMLFFFCFKKWMFMFYKSTSVPGTDFDYNVTNQGEAAFGGLVQSSTVISYLPERPDQPECRRFMSTGSCKYGSDCKYHHPRERIAQWTTNSLGPLGLPSRPVSFISI